MKKVYVVTAGSYSDYHIEAVFSTEDLAKAFVDKEIKGKSYQESYSYDEWDIDVSQDKWITTSVRMGKDGTVIDTWQDKSVTDLEEFSCFDTNNNLVWDVKTEDIQRAIKVTNEKRMQILAMNLWGKDNKVRELIK